MMSKSIYCKIVVLIVYFQILSCFSSQALDINKSIYIPTTFGGMDLNNESSQWCYSRSKESVNFIVFWEAGYGTNPKTTANSTYRVDVDAILDLAETSFRVYSDSLQFIIEGNSKTDTYKMIILLYYSTTWQASGSGVDDMIGLLSLSANAAQTLGVTVAHEVGHCFQYQVHCDGHQGGWMYGFGTNGSGGNCWWEQCAQWQAFKVLPAEQFTNYQFANYLANANKNILHEEPRYANYFIQDYWTFLHGPEFIGQLWRDSKYPEDPVEAYKRLTQITQSEFNDEMYSCAARFTTWDIPSLMNYGKNYIDAHESSPMILSEDDYWVIDSAKCIENYGYNVIRLNVPDQGTTLKVYFEGKAGDEGFRNYNKNNGGWRYGLVALLEDGTRVYSSMRSASYHLLSLTNPKDTLTFDCPANCSRLWLVVSGAPVVHWHHAWDDDASNDEQWPYQVKFENTNLYGVYNFTEEDVPYNETLIQNITLKPVTANTNPYPSTPVQPNWETVCKALCLQLSEIKAAFGSSVKYCAVNPNGSLNYTSTAIDPGHWFNRTGYTTNWGNNSYIFSEFNINNLTFNIGQYPNLCKDGDEFTIRQALVYTPPSGTQVKVTFVFNVTISNEIETYIFKNRSNNLVSPVKNTIVKDDLFLADEYDEVVVYNLDGRLIKKASRTNQINLSDIPAGIYLISANGLTVKIVKTK